MTTLTPTDQKELLQKLQNGDETAFEMLYLQYYKVLYLHAYQKLRDREAAKDIVQDLFAGIWQKREVLHINTGLTAYLYTAVRNRILDYISKEKSKAAYVESLPAIAEYHQASTDHLLRERMLKAQIESAVEQLSPRLKQIFELSRKEHLSHKEISERLNLSEQSVRSYVKDALRILRVKLNTFLWMLLVVCTLLK